MNSYLKRKTGRAAPPLSSGRRSLALLLVLSLMLPYVFALPAEAAENVTGPVVNLTFQGAVEDRAGQGAGVTVYDDQEKQYPPDYADAGVDYGPTNDATSSFGGRGLNTYWQWNSSSEYGGGLTIDVPTSLIDGKTYSLGLRFSLGQVSGYKKVIDFQNRGTDNGFYIHDGKVNFFTTSTQGDSSSFSPNTVYNFLIVRDETAKTFKVYLNGDLENPVYAMENIDDNVAVPAQVTVSSQEYYRFGFFYDDLAFNDGASNTGKVYSIKMWDRTLEDSEISDTTLLLSGNSDYDIGWYTDDPSADSFVITTAQELAGFGALVNSGVSFSGKTVTLANSVDLSAYTAWDPIGESYPFFQGTFDGGGNTISGLSVDSTDLQFAGLFGYTYTGAALKDVNVAGSVEASLSSGGGLSVGGLVGCAVDTNISGCSSSADVTASQNAETFGNNTGGLVGAFCTYDSEASLTDSFATGDVVSSSSICNNAVFNQCGGLVGALKGYSATYKYSVESCYATGSVTGANTNNANLRIGGLAGLSCYGAVTQSWASGAVDCSVNTGYRYAGGLVGECLDDSVIDDCYSESALSQTGIVSYSYVGGLSGYNIGSIANSYFAGSVTVGGEPTASWSGGLCGYNDGSVANCYSSANVTLSGDMMYIYSGGLVGECQGTLVNSYTSGIGVSTATNIAAFFGGVVGYAGNTSSVSYCYFSKNESVNPLLSPVCAGPSDGCGTYAVSGGAVTLSSDTAYAVSGTTPIKDALQAWVKDMNLADYDAWKNDEASGNPVLDVRWVPEVFPFYYYSCDGATLLDSSSVVLRRGNDLIVSDYVPTKAGYSFNGWATEENSSVVAYIPGDDYTGVYDAASAPKPESLSLYAVWDDITDLNGSHTALLTTELPYGSSAGTQKQIGSSFTIGGEAIVEPHKSVHFVLTGLDVDYTETDRVYLIDETSSRQYYLGFLTREVTDGSYTVSVYSLPQYILRSGHTFHLWMDAYCSSGGFGSAVENAYMIIDEGAPNLTDKALSLTYDGNLDTSFSITDSSQGTYSLYYALYAFDADGVPSQIAEANGSVTSTLAAETVTDTQALGVNLAKNTPYQLNILMMSGGEVIGIVTRTFYLYSYGYDLNGASGTAPQGGYVVSDETLTAPTDPTYSGHVFKGWYTDKAGTDKWDFASDIANTDLTLYAGWRTASSGGSSETRTITVSSVTSGVFDGLADSLFSAQANVVNAFSSSVEVRITDSTAASGKMISLVGAGGTVYPFDISLYIKGTDTKTEPADGYAVTITMPLPVSLTAERESLTLVHSADGALTAIPFTLSQKGTIWYVTFKADSFSPYALVVGMTKGLQAVSQSGIPYYLESSGNKVFIGFSMTSDGVTRYIETTGKEVSFASNPKSFSDISGHWAKGNISFVTERELFLGTGSSVFSPDSSMTRAMFATVLGRLYERSYGAISSVSSGDFSDVGYASWYGKYVSWATQNGIITGVGGGEFQPEREITRQEMAAMLYRFADYLGVGPAGDWAVALAYPDAASISDWAAEGAMYCQLTGIIKGRDGGCLAPLETASRAEVAVILERLVESVLA